MTLAIEKALDCWIFFSMWSKRTWNTRYLRFRLTMDQSVQTHSIKLIIAWRIRLQISTISWTPNSHDFIEAMFTLACSKSQQSGHNTEKYLYTQFCTSEKLLKRILNPINQYDVLYMAYNGFHVFFAAFSCVVFNDLLGQAMGLHPNTHTKSDIKKNLGWSLDFQT